MNAPISLHNLLPVSGLQQGTDVIHESAHLHVTPVKLRTMPKCW